MNRRCRDTYADGPLHNVFLTVYFYVLNGVARWDMDNVRKRKNERRREDVR
jgi:hypothetical protein